MWHSLEWLRHDAPLHEAGEASDSAIPRFRNHESRGFQIPLGVANTTHKCNVPYARNCGMRTDSNASSKALVRFEFKLNVEAKHFIELSAAAKRQGVRSEEACSL